MEPTFLWHLPTSFRLKYKVIFLLFFCLKNLKLNTAAYDAVDKLGSLVVRLVLQPFEESAAIYFGTNLKRTEDSSNNNTAIPDEVANVFLILTRLILTFGILAFTYGSSYARFAAELYGGRRFIESQGFYFLMV